MGGAQNLFKMNYLKISEVANKCEVQQQLINEHYRLIGANPNLSEEIRTMLYAEIEYMKKQLGRFEKVLRKFIA